ncbi:MULTISPECIES: helix-turn-helix domain-containing protein [unclassified Pseudomonas]|uniref:helix-turn-helix domain-containing protein n=1 Tax=unclassified Pseudomonas TaxID=196821 RepID=UPI000A1E7C8B|nr:MULTISPECIES: transcriptional regulator [unclassified Pseudomonas]POA56933.1 transcriptional regulator [Pseudomonas sp. FW507-12TSA]
MSVLIKQAAEHWQFVAPLLRKPRTEEDYDRLVQALDELLDLAGDDEAHPLNSLLEIIGDWIEAYDLEHRPIPKASGIDVLRYLMREHGLTQSDLPGVGAQSVVSEVLSGKRQLNLRQVRWLSERFKVAMEVFA